MFWNNCPGLLCYMLAFYPNVHLISIRMSVYMNWSQISSHFLHRHPSEGNSSPTLEHHPDFSSPLSEALRQVPRNCCNQQMNFVHPFGSLSYYKNEGEKRIPVWRRDEAWGQGQEEAPHRLPSSPDSPCWQTQCHPLTWGTLFHTTTFFPSCSLLSAILFLTCQNPGPRPHDRSCNSCYKSCKGVILLMSHIATQPPLDMRMLRPTKPFPFQDPWREGPMSERSGPKRSTGTPAMGLLMAGTRQRGS